MTDVTLAWEALTLALVDPFRIAHGVSTTRDNVLVQLEGALGEAAAVSYLGETRDGIIEYLRRVDPKALDVGRPPGRAVSRLAPGSAAARAAIDMALHDAWGRAEGKPLYELLGLDPGAVPPTSLTIPIASPEWMAERARSSGQPILKIKLGGAGDAERVSAIRAATTATLRADANAGWSVEEAERMLPLLAEHGVELVEQPLRVGDLEGLSRLARLPRRPALFADESIKGLDDIRAHAGLVDGIVVKLAKSGGICGALEQIELAHRLGLSTMIGCMIESSLAVTAAAHIAPLARYADLDGPLLIRDDPFTGVRYRAGRLALPGAPGLGVVRIR